MELKLKFLVRVNMERRYFKSYHSGIETDNYLTGDVSGWSLNRTIVELKLKKYFFIENFNFIFKSYHSGIETASKSSILSSSSSFKSYHSGIETCNIRYRSSRRVSLNRTIVELKRGI